MNRIDLTSENTTKLNKRLKNTLKDKLPDLNLSEASEIVAKTLGFNSVHHLQSIMSAETKPKNKKTYFLTDEDIKKIPQYIAYEKESIFELISNDNDKVYYRIFGVKKSHPRELILLKNEKYNNSNFEDFYFRKAIFGNLSGAVSNIDMVIDNFSVQETIFQILKKLDDKYDFLRPIKFNIEEMNKDFLRIHPKNKALMFAFCFFRAVDELSNEIRGGFEFDKIDFSLGNNLFFEGNIKNKEQETEKMWFGLWYGPNASEFICCKSSHNYKISEKMKIKDIMNYLSDIQKSNSSKLKM